MIFFNHYFLEFETLFRNDKNIFFVASLQKKDQLTCDLVFFQLYSPTASCMHFVRDIAFGSDMRFAR